MMESDSDIPHDLASLAQMARLSRYHFLRTFEGLTGATPHQYLLRIRLRRAALRLRTEPAKILDVALDCGFGDVSNFNHAFRVEFGVSPRGYRLLRRIPRLPPSAADLLIEQFGSLQKLLSASAADLQQVHGLDPGLATSVREGLARLAESALLDRYP